MRGAVSMALAYNQVKEKRKLSVILKNTSLLNCILAILHLLIDKNEIVYELCWQYQSRI